MRRGILDAARMKELESRLASEMPVLLDDHGSRGAQVAVGLDGRVALSACYGEASTGRAMTADTVFRAASIAKCVTALCVLRLADRGVIGLDDPFARFTPWRLPASRCHGHDQGAVTIRHLLSHCSGLDTAKFPEIPPDAEAPSARDILDGCFGELHTPHLREGPGSACRYAGSNFEVLRLVIEGVTGESLAVVVEREVIRPLGLRRTWLGPRPGGGGCLHAAHFDATESRVPDAYYPAMGSSGLYTTAAELASIWLAIGGEPCADGRSLLSPPMQDQMLRTHGTTADGYRFGLGIGLAEWKPHELFKHAGMPRGLFAMAEGLRGGCVVVMCNSDNAKSFVLPLVGRLTGWLISELNQSPASR